MQSRSFATIGVPKRELGNEEIITLILALVAILTLKMR